MAERRFNPDARVNPRHLQPTRRVDQPEPGWFKMRLCKGGPLVAARIAYAAPVDPHTGQPQEERSLLWAGIINGADDPNPTPAPTETVWRIWTYGERITQADYDFLLADRQWAAAHAPHLPEANPRQAVDLSQVDPSSLF